jgi:heterodisulfide reductase subunit A-like polyferredoxin
MTEENVNLQESEPKTGSEKIGAVMVVGGGIAAMQSSLDLADCGFQVHMVTNQPCIGGNMVRLDKVWADCIKCVHFPNCNEVALITEL